MCLPVSNTASYVCVTLVPASAFDSRPSVEHSEWETDGVRTISYRCQDGYFTDGGTSVSYYDFTSGSWSPVDLTCVLLDCGSPPAVHGATLELTQMANGLQALYTCLAGSVPITPSMSSVCDASTMSWSPDPGDCTLVSCGQPPTVETMEGHLSERDGGEMFPGLNSDTVKFAFGGEATYTCKEGFTPSAREAVYASICQEDGTWSFTSNLYCLPIDCGPPPDVANSSSVIFPSTTLGSIATVYCNSGFSPVQGFNVTCQPNGSWAESGGACEYIEDQWLVTSTLTGTLEDHSTGSTLDVKDQHTTISTVADQNQPLISSTLDIDIKHTTESTLTVEHQPVRSTTLEIDDQPLMNSTDNPSFTVGPCIPPELPDKMYITSTTSTEPTSDSNSNTIVVECLPGYFMVWWSKSSQLQSATLTCVDGIWSELVSDIACLPDACDPHSVVITNSRWSTWTDGTDQSEHIGYQCETGFVFPVIKSQDGNQDIRSREGRERDQTVSVEPTTTMSFVCPLTATTWDSLVSLGEGCKLIDCGHINITLGSYLQTPDSYNTSYSSTVKLHCHTSTFETYVNTGNVRNTVECQSDGQWAPLVGDLDIRCTACDQGADAAGVPNSVLEMALPEAGVVSTTANMTCLDGFLAVDLSNPLQCELVAGEPSWTGVGSARCIPYRFRKNVVPDTDDIYTMPIDISLVETSLKACAVLTMIDDQRFVVMLMENEGIGNYRTGPARVSYIKKHDRKELLEFQVTSATAPVIINIIHSEPNVLMEVHETATLCIILNLVTNKYEFTKNDQLIMSMDVQRYHDIKHLFLRRDVNVSEFHIYYNTISPSSLSVDNSRRSAVDLISSG